MEFFPPHRINAYTSYDYHHLEMFFKTSGEYGPSLEFETEKIRQTEAMKKAIRRRNPYCSDEDTAFASVVLAIMMNEDINATMTKVILVVYYYYHEKRIDYESAMAMSQTIMRVYLNTPELHGILIRGE